ncbi:MAG: hypothetical protein H0W88_04030 [Parachlamydiaceae bacterium]|nr:hypothetical protein [Parachlamydiaceae bacterium]
MRFFSTDNPTFFVVVQSIMVMKKFDQALKLLEKRIENGGDKDEVWYSKLMMGEIYEEMVRLNIIKKLN